MASLLRANIRVPLWAIIAVLVTNFMAVFSMIVLVSRSNSPLGSAENFNYLKEAFRENSILNDETNVKIPTHNNGKQMSREERLRYLELKVNSYIGFGTDPFFGVKEQSIACRITSKEDDNFKGLFDQTFCLDGLPGYELEPKLKQEKPGKIDPPCLIYDFGIRKQPKFGEVMAQKIGCEVHAFDPSDISIKWWHSDRDDAKALRDIPNYHFHPYGAGGVDGHVVLKEYNWGQVSILRYPTYIVKCNEEGIKRRECDVETHTSKSFKLPVKTLSTIMKELGHEGRTIDILKLDVEGSEYVFLENLLDSTAGCPDFVNQVALEWHHFPWDARYGEGASPSINVLATLLYTCGLKNIDQHSEGGWPSSDRIYHDLGMDNIRYNLATFYRGTEPEVK